MVEFQAIEQIERILEQILQSGVRELDLLRQLHLFRFGMAFTHLGEACTVENGTILRVDETDAKRYTTLANAAIAGGRVMKFVPASGAATRMFKSLLAVEDAHSEIPLNLLQERAENNSDYRFTLQFVNNIRSFAFFNSLKNVLARDGYDIEQLLERKEYSLVLRYVQHDIGLNYANVPKGLIEFHHDANTPNARVRTAFEEHIADALDYTCDSEGNARVHFTVSPEHLENVQKHLDAAQKNVTTDKRLHISLSEQKRSTNTIAVTPENEPFLTEDKLHFRPAGHGALLENLNDMQADIVIIKNIDNVVPDRIKATTFASKRLLCGLLIEVQSEIFAHLRAMETESLDRARLLAIAVFAEQRLLWTSPENSSDEVAQIPNEELQAMLFSALHRPLRVCGMVKNSGEPGGGPFIVHHHGGSRSLQIVESAQINLSNAEQKAIFDSSTHFNPVDLVCGVRDFRGQPFNVLEFRDDETGFISLKSNNGRELKALELPGLWNGSMAHWNTIFVEVSSETFHPVKTINDLLKPEHQ
jgi:Domain of unknown function (DUF4301)